MARRSFAQRNETFGLDTARPWALHAFRLLFNVPRAYEPLVDAWDARHPGTRRALDRLVDAGFVAHQPPVIIDTRTGLPASAPSRRVARYRTTAKGRRRLAEWREDIRVFEDVYPRTSGKHLGSVVALLAAFDLEDSHARFGLSAGHAIALAGLPERLGRWWLARFLADGLLRQLRGGDGPLLLADAREVIPAHWRVTRALCRQLDDVIDSFDSVPATMRVEFRLRRSRWLGDIDPARVGISGATDFDHDVTAQQVIAALLRSPRCAPEGIFMIEPRIVLPLDTSVRPWRFALDGDGRAFYQPDAELRERSDPGDGATVTRRVVVEYERFQSRRDAWSHIERFLGYLHTMAHPREPAVLCFVVDSEARARGYVELVEAFCDHALDHPELMPPNPVTLAVSHVAKVLGSPDPLNPHEWARIRLPRLGAGADTAPRPVLHARGDSPYEDYFART